MDQSWYSVLKSITEQKSEISIWGVPTFIPLGKSRHYTENMTTYNIQESHIKRRERKSKEVISEEIRWYAEVMILK